MKYAIFKIKYKQQNNNKYSKNDPKGNLSSNAGGILVFLITKIWMKPELFSVSVFLISGGISSTSSEPEVMQSYILKYMRHHYDSQVNEKNIQL